MKELGKFELVRRQDPIEKVLGQMKNTFARLLEESHGKILAPEVQEQLEGVIEELRSILRS